MAARTLDVDVPSKKFGGRRQHFKCTLTIIAPSVWLTIFRDLTRNCFFRPYSLAAITTAATLHHVKVKWFTNSFFPFHPKPAHSPTHPPTHSLYIFNISHPPTHLTESNLCGRVNVASNLRGRFWRHGANFFLGRTEDVVGEAGGDVPPSSSSSSSVRSPPISSVRSVVSSSSCRTLFGFIRVGLGLKYYCFYDFV